MHAAIICMNIYSIVCICLLGGRRSLTCLSPWVIQEVREASVQQGGCWHSINMNKNILCSESMKGTLPDFGHGLFKQTLDINTQSKSLFTHAGFLKQKLKEGRHLIVYGPQTVCQVLWPWMLPSFKRDAFRELRYYIIYAVHYKLNKKNPGTGMQGSHVRRQNIIGAREIMGVYSKCCGYSYCVGVLHGKPLCTSTATMN